MTVAAIRQKLHQYLDTAEDKTIKALYTIIGPDIEQKENASIYTEEFKKELMEDYEDYQRTRKTTSKEDVDKHINSLLASYK